MTDEPTPIRCGGCGATDESKRCIGCMHDFGTPTNAWVHKYGPPLVWGEPVRAAGGVSGEPSTQATEER